MKTNFTIAVLVIAAMSLSVSAWALPVTEGLTGVSVAVTGDSSVGFDYSFTVFNNSVDAYLGWNVLIGELNISNVVAGTKQNLLAPASVVSPTGWGYTTNGGWKSSSIISYNSDNSIKYFAPPSVAPGESLSGFVLHYDSAFDSTAFDYETHVYAVEPLTGPITDPQYYNPTTVNLNSSIYNSKITGVAYTWWDKPGDGGGNPNEVPEASTIVLSALGMLGFGLKRMRFSK